jgi:hypothetical protein
VSWNYRVLKTLDEQGGEQWGIHEVYYKPDGSVRTWTVDPVRPVGETWQEFHRDQEHYARAVTQLPLDCTGETATELTITGRTKGSGKARKR